MDIKTEKRLLQTIVAIGCLVPLSAGLFGIVHGTGLNGPDAVNIDNHFRYLSGLLLGIGLGFLSCLPNVEYKTTRVRILTFVVIIGGLGRLAGFLIAGTPGKIMVLALAMELIITPALCLWQNSLARRYQA